MVRIVSDPKVTRFFGLKAGFWLTSRPEASSDLEFSVTTLLLGLLLLDRSGLVNEIRDCKELLDFLPDA